MASIIWGPEIAEVYDKTYAAQSTMPVLGPIVDILAELARGGPALEFAVGTGRVALPLSARGIAVHGIELSPHMAERMLAKPGANAVPVTIGDMTSTRAPGTFRQIAFGEGHVWATVFEIPISEIDPATNQVVKQWFGPGGDSIRVAHGSVWLSNLREGNVWRLSAKQP